jgi:hypothetical protein
MLEGIPGIEIAIIELIVKKDKSSSWIHNNYIRKLASIFQKMLSEKEILPPLTAFEKDYSDIEII